MKTHYKKINGKWSVFKDKTEVQPILCGVATLWGAGVEWKKWCYIQSVLSQKPIEWNPKKTAFKDNKLPWWYVDDDGGLHFA